MAMATGGHASGEAVVATVIVLSCVSTFAVAMRLYARCGVAKNAGWDDGLIVISAVCFTLANHTRCHVHC